MSRRLKVMRVVIGLNQGGVQQGVYNLCRGLDVDRFEVIVCAIENGGAIGEEIKNAGFEVIVLDIKRSPFKTIPELVRIMKERQIDIVHASSNYPSTYARIAGIIARVPILIGYEHVVFDRNRFNRWLLNRILQPFTSAYTAVGYEVAKQVKEWYSYPDEKVHVVHNGVDTDRFYPVDDRCVAKRRLGLDADLPVVAMVSRLDPEKGHCYFFDAISQIQEPVQWLVVGMGREQDNVYRQAREKGVYEKIHFLGLRRDIHQLLAASDIYVFPTLKEGFPNSLLEAMSCGCAVVASDFPGNLEVVKNKVNALVVPMKNSEALQERIEDLLSDGKLRKQLGMQARKDIESNFSLSAYSHKMAALYTKLWNQCARI